MDFAYEDIINRQRPVHVNDDFGRKYPQMPRLNRAKIFAPYAALRGFEGHIESKQVPYVARYIPDPEEERELNRRIGILYEKCRNGRLARLNRLRISVTRFVPCADPNHEDFGVRGQYQTVEGLLRKVDISRQTLTVDQREIDFGDIAKITGPKGLFAQK